MAETGKIKWFNTQKKYGFIERESGKDIFIHLDEWYGPKNKLREGQEVEFEIQETPKGLAAKNANLPGQMIEMPPPDYHFLNPYNFVRYLPDRTSLQDEPPATQLLGRCEPPPHDRWVGVSGRIKLRAEAITPVFIADSEEVRVEKDISLKKKHYSYRFFRIGKQKAIPATTLRGVVRSVFEAATNSCFANFTGQRLSYRLPPGEVQKLVPGRIIKDDEGKWWLYLLPGQAPFAPEKGQKKGLYASPARFYKALVTTSKRPGPPPPAIDGAPDSWEHGQRYFAVLRKMKFPPSWRVLALSNDEKEAQHMKTRLQGNSRQQLVVQSGWLCKTNQNADNKHSERFFFRDTTDPDIPERLSLPTKVRRNYEELIQDYQTRHADAVKKRDTPDKVEDGDIAFSRFVINLEESQLKGDGHELVYARLLRRKGKLQVKFIAPVSWPRVAYEHTIADLLPAHLEKCTSPDHLCPACRTFGWVWDGEGESETSMPGSAIKAYAGRVRFTHALLQKPGNEKKPMTLAILGSPKPTTTRFYLADPNGKPSTKPRGDLEVGYEGNHGQNTLRGRKFYRHFVPDDKHLLHNEQSDQNRTIRDAEGAGVKFAFTVEFENLAPVEVGALLWSLTLGEAGYHKVGYAKPLGLGSIAFSVENVRLYDFSTRYKKLASEEWQQQLTQEQQKSLIATFHEAAARPYATDEMIAIGEEQGASVWKILFQDLPNIQDMLALLGRKTPELPVHYPYSPDPKSNGSFEWFVGNNRLNGPRVELSLANEDEGLPLINRQGDKH